MMRPSNTDVDLYWINGVAGSEHPRSPGDIEWLKRQGINAIVTLSEYPLPAEWTAGMRVLHSPVPDFHAPALAQLHEIVRFLDECRSAHCTPLVHCAMGRGRTGTVLAAWLIAHGAPVQQALQDVRAQRPGAVETDEQENMLYEFAIDCRTGEAPPA